MREITGNTQGIKLRIKPPSNANINAVKSERPSLFASSILVTQTTAINADDWEGYTADGSVVKGSDTHIEILDNWFKTANPKWEIKWMIANAAENEDGVVVQWLTTGNDYTDTDENGNEISNVSQETSVTQDEDGNIISTTTTTNNLVEPPTTTVVTVSTVTDEKGNT